MPKRGDLKWRFRGAVSARVLRRELEAQHGKPTLVIPPLSPGAAPPRGDRPRVVHVKSEIDRRVAFVPSPRNPQLLSFQWALAKGKLSVRSNPHQNLSAKA